MTGIDFFLGGCNEHVDQVIGFHAKTLTSGNLNIGPGFIFFRELIAQFSRATRRERYHLVGKMSVVIGLPVVPKSAQGFDHAVLGFRLACINDVINFLDATKMRMIQRPDGS